jgi:hypothetical protein
MSGEICGIITAETVRAAYRAASPRWQVPSAPDCEAIADVLELCRGARVEREARHQAKKPEAAGIRRMRRHEKVRSAIGTLLRDLPDLAEWAPAHVVTPGGLHASSLAELLDAVRRVAVLWPSLNGSIRRFDRRSRWALTADCLVGMLLRAWRKANPKRRIGKPLKETQPATQLLVSLLALVEGQALTAGQVAKHFNRKKSGFVLIDWAERQKNA